MNRTYGLLNRRPVQEWVSRFPITTRAKPQTEGGAEHTLRAGSDELLINRLAKRAIVVGADPVMEHLKRSEDTQ